MDMKNLKQIAIIIVIHFFLNFNHSYCQDFSKNSIKIGLGGGASMDGTNDGAGFIYSLGYQLDMWKGRLRFNPNFSIGHYSSKFITDARDQYFISRNIETNLYLDLIKIKAFSLVAGCGGVVCNLKGLKGTEVTYGMYMPQQKSEYFSNYYYGAYLGGGFRINPPSRRIAFNIMPINIHVGNSYFTEFYAKFEIDVKLY
jgi:hypothetical protein